MLRRLEITNYKPFERFELDFNARTLLIGPNNAGKTSLISAFKLVAHLSRPGQLRGFEVVGPGEMGVYFEPEDLGISMVNLTFNYAPDPSNIRAFFDDGLELRLVLSRADGSYGSWYYDDTPLHRADFVRQY